MWKMAIKTLCVWLIEDEILLVAHDVKKTLKLNFKKHSKT